MEGSKAHLLKGIKCHNFVKILLGHLPKEKLGGIVPFLEDVLKYEYLPGWKRLMKKLEAYFKIRWGEYWQKAEANFWEDFKKMDSSKW